MPGYNKKIINSADELKRNIFNLKNKVISVCQGHFNVIHPGHLRFLEFAREQGNFLVVLLQSQEMIKKNIRNKFYRTDERANGVASLEIVDLVIIFNKNNFEEIINIIQPQFYVLGKEFSKNIEAIKSDIEIVEKNKGKVIFSSGEINYYSSELINKNIDRIEQERKLELKDAIKKQKISKNILFDLINNFKNKNILVVGDTIVDQYVFCDAIGMSSEAPVVVLKEMRSKEFIGGAAILAKNIKSLGAKCFFISLIGNDNPAKLVKKELKKEKIISKLIIDRDRPTTYKIRYIVEAQKILRVSRLKDYYIDTTIEDTIINYFNNSNDKFDGIIISDFGYGLITPRVLEHISKFANKKHIKLYGDSQSSSQIGDIKKFNSFFLLAPSEKEARIALSDKYSGLEVVGTRLVKELNLKNIILTLGAGGFITFQKTEDKEFIKSQHFPAINPYPVDVVGAGDTLLSGFALSIASGANIMEASVISTVLSSIEVSKMGNIPVSINELINFIKEL